jgi:hypothetical protein
MHELASLSSNHFILLTPVLNDGPELLSEFTYIASTYVSSRHIVALYLYAFSMGLAICVAKSTYYVFSESL